MALERIQANNNAFDSNAANVSASTDPRQMRHDTNEMLIRGAAAASAMDELELTVEETMTALNRKNRRKNERKTRNEEEKRRLAQWNQSQKSVFDQEFKQELDDARVISNDEAAVLGDKGEIAQDMLQNFGGVDPITGRTKSAEIAQAERAGARGKSYADPNEFTVFRKRRDGSSVPETIYVPEGQKTPKSAADEAILKSYGLRKFKTGQEEVLDKRGEQVYAKDGTPMFRNTYDAAPILSETGRQQTSVAQNSLNRIYEKLNTGELTLETLIPGSNVSVANLIGKPSQKHGIPFVVFLRTSIGIHAAKYLGLTRGLVGIFMFGVQTYFLSKAFSYLIRISIFSIDKTILDQDIFLTFLLGLNIIDGFAFLLAILLQTFLFSRGHIFNRLFVNFSTTAVYLGMIFFTIAVISDNSQYILDSFVDIVNFENIFVKSNIIPLLTVAGTIFAYFSIIILSLFLETDILLPFLKEKVGLYLNVYYLFFIVLFFSILIFVLIKIFKKGILKKISNLIEGISIGFTSVLKMKNKFSYAAHTILIWFIYILVFYIMKFSLNGTELLDFKTLLVSFIFGAISITTTNGGVGVYPLSVSVALSFYGIPFETGLAFGWITWTVQTLVIIFFGVLSFFLLPIVNNKV